MKGALHKWMAQKGSKDMKIHDEESETMHDRADVGGTGGEIDHEGMLKREASGHEPFDIPEHYASLLGLGSDKALERGERHTGNKSPMSKEHSQLLGMDDDDDDGC